MSTTVGSTGGRAHPTAGQDARVEQVRSDPVRHPASRRGGRTARLRPNGVSERIAHLIGIGDSGGAGLSERTGDKVRAILRARRAVRAAH